MNKVFSLCIIAVFAFSCSDQPASEPYDSVPPAAQDSGSTSAAQPSASFAAPKVFYYDYTEKRTSGDEPVDMSKDEALEILKTLPVSDGNFFGLDLGDRGIVQFMYDDKGTLMLDIPDPETMESFQQNTTLDEALKIVGDVYDGKSPDDVKEMVK